ncbi:MAG: hypothetical protein AAGF97_10740 [Planctomycetota bacterium]
MMRWMTLMMVVTGLARVATADLLAHYEYECHDPLGCLQTAQVGQEVSYEVEVYPGSMEFGTYLNGDAVDFIVAPPAFLVDYLTNGQLDDPEPSVFMSYLVGVGGSGVGIDKEDWREGTQFDGDRHRYAAGYHVPLLNEVDLQGYAITDLRFQLYEVEVLPSHTLGGSALRTHFRVEVLGHLVPEPALGGWLAGAVWLLMAGVGRARCFV